MYDVRLLVISSHELVIDATVDMSTINRSITGVQEVCDSSETQFEGGVCKSRRESTAVSAEAAVLSRFLHVSREVDPTPR